MQAEPGPDSPRLPIDRPAPPPARSPGPDAPAAVRRNGRLRSRRRHRGRGRRVALGLLVLVGLAVAAVVVASAAGGRIGFQLARPTTADELAPEYRLLAGRQTLDLSGLEVPAGGVGVQASVGVGTLTVRLPEGVDATIVARSAAGDVVMLGHEHSGLLVEVEAEEVFPGGAGDELVIDLSVRLGSIEVTR